jgi:hypothetical protein
VPDGKKEPEELKTSCQIDLMSFSNTDTPHPNFLRALIVAETAKYSITVVIKRPTGGMWKNES